MNRLGRKLLKGALSQRSLQTLSARQCAGVKAEQDVRGPEEVWIPVPWGFVAGKWWGAKSSRACVAVHGLLDNANSFDKLVPLLEHPSILCIDLPGHGHSSHLPKGITINYNDYIITLRYVIKHCLKLDEPILLGHSYGSSLCFTYAALFPREVRLMVNIDCSRLFTAAKPERTVKEFRTSMSAFISSEKDSGIPEAGYSWEDTVRHLHNLRARLGMPLSLEGSELIAKRATKKIEDVWYRFSSDGRIKERSIGRYTKNMNLAFARRITCPVLNIHAKDGLLTATNPFLDLKELDLHLQELEKYSKSLVTVVVEGCHHAHIDHPKDIATSINHFFKNNA